VEFTEGKAIRHDRFTLGVTIGKDVRRL